MTSQSCWSQRGARRLAVKPRQQRRHRVVGLERRNRHHRLRPRTAPALGGMAHHGAEAPRDAVGCAQISVGEHDEDGAVALDRAEIHLSHQLADDAGAIKPGARVLRVEGEARDGQAAAIAQALTDRGRKVAIEGESGNEAGLRVEQPLGFDRVQGAAELGLKRMLADQRQRVGCDESGRAKDNFKVRQVVARRL